MAPARGTAAAVCVLVLTGACSGAPPAEPSPSASGVVPAGGTLRIVVPRTGESFTRFVDAEGDPAVLDPHLDYFASYDSTELLRCCLTRTLLSSNGRSAEEGGARLHPDLAAEMPDVSADGLSWTFRLRPGLHFGPPFEEVEITAADFVRGFQRLAAPTLEDHFPAQLFGDIVGLEAYAAGQATSIAGLETPDPHTLILRLTKPAGDLAARLAMALVIPIPAHPTDARARYGVATGHDAGYGRFLVSSGPYMLEGSPALDFSRPPSEQTPVAGLVPGQSIRLVRNPSWDRSTDALRQAHADSIEYEVVDSMDTAVSEVYARRAHLLLHWTLEQQIPTEVVDEVRADPARGRVYVNESDAIVSMLMNVARPPFDDINVRRAVSHAIDKAAIVELLGGPLTVRVAHHLVPDAVVDNLLVDYRPYGTPGDAGDPAAARAEMAKSKYDTDGDGICDAAECSDVLAVGRAEPFPPVAESVREDLAAIGIELRLEKRAGEDFFSAWQDPTQRVGMILPIGWAKDSLSPAGFFVGQFYSPVAFSEEGANGSLVGASARQLEAWGYGDVDVPNVDSRIEACLPQTGAAQFECWAEFDQHMMENVVPSVPFGSSVGVVLASADVVNYEWDQLVAAPSLDQIVIRP